MTKQPGNFVSPRETQGITKPSIEKVRIIWMRIRCKTNPLSFFILYFPWWSFQFAFLLWYELVTQGSCADIQYSLWDMEEGCPLCCLELGLWVVIKVRWGHHHRAPMSKSEGTHTLGLSLSVATLCPAPSWDSDSKRVITRSSPSTLDLQNKGSKQSYLLSVSASLCHGATGSRNWTKIFSISNWEKLSPG